MRSLSVEPLTRQNYAAYGDVIEPREPATSTAANQGSARKWNHVAAFDRLRSGARTNVSVFECAPRRFPFVLELLEKHPQSSQIFVPMQGERYLVVVALGGDAPDLGTLRAFVVSGTQGISYRPGVWHHPMIAVGRASLFACLVDEDGTGDDCVEVALAPEDRRVISDPAG